MRRQYHVLQLQQLRMHRGLVFKHVNACSCDYALLERIRQRRFIHDSSARGIDKDGCGFHQPELIGADHLACLGQQRHVNADVIRFAQQTVRAHEFRVQLALHPFRRTHCVAIQNAHVKSAAAACYGLADPSHSENTQRAVMHVLPHQQIDAPLIPLARVHELMALDHAPRSRHQQCESEIGRCVRKDIGRIRHQNLPACCGRRIDIVEPHRNIGDDADALQFVDHRRRKLVGQLAHNRLLATNAPQQLVGGQAVIRIDVIDFGALLQIFNGFWINTPGNQYCGFHRTAIVAQARFIVQLRFKDTPLAGHRPALP